MMKPRVGDIWCYYTSDGGVLKYKILKVVEREDMILIDYVYVEGGVGEYRNVNFNTSHFSDDWIDEVYLAKRIIESYE